MIAEDVQTGQVIVESKGQVGEDSDRSLVVYLHEVLEPGEGEVLEKDACILDDIGIVVELEGDAERIGIGGQGDDRHEADNKKVFDGKRKYKRWCFEDSRGSYNWSLRFSSLGQTDFPFQWVKIQC
jgi:hypothetical protein